MDAASAQALSLRLLPGLLLFARRKGWAEPRPVSAQQLQQFQILVALTLATARPLPPAPARAPDTSRQEPGLFGTLRSLDRQMDTYEDTRLLDLARNEIPMDRIRAEAAVLQQSADPLSEHDALAQALVQWFKHDYFKWADPIKCPKCDGSTDVAGMVPATDYERKGGAGRVELHVCKGENGACDGSFRFARFNNLEYLMRTRLGRCGEWANLYTLFLRAVGLRARYVWNAEDHVWNEYYSPAAGRWLHTDSCEAARDQPLLYDKGWGKKMSYIIAFSVDGASDVSRGYVQNSNEMLQRRKLVSEPALAEEISRLTAARRRNLSPARLAELAAEDETERAWLAESDHRAAPDEHARQSGTQEWKEARGEAGPSA